MPTSILDTECYRNYWLCKFMRHDNGAQKAFEIFPDSDPLDWKMLWKVLKTYKLVTFNGNNYDMPMIIYAITLAKNGTSPQKMCEKLKQASDWIILQNHKSWEFEEEFGIKIPRDIDHIDLIEPAFGQGSLKLYGGRLHSRKLQELPIEPGAMIDAQGRVDLSLYCSNDLQTTKDLYDHLKDPLDLRQLMTTGYGIDLRSKSDAQISEAIIKKHLTKVLGDRPIKPQVRPGRRFNYKPPAWVRFDSKVLNDLLHDIATQDFVVGPNGYPIEIPCLVDREITINKTTYSIGIGGIHSCEKTTAHIADADYTLSDHDVASYYPSIILNCKLFPEHLTEAFLKIYGKIFTERIAAKRAGQKTVADTLKIVLNGCFGKLGSPFSIFYSTDLLIQVTLTGQLGLLMLAEAFEAAGFEVISANTDGIVIRTPKSRIAERDRIIKEWEAATGFETEETRYLALYSRDINNYFALKDKGGVKGKGAFAPVSISKNPKNQICNDAVMAFLEHGTPIAQTILSCKDIRRFVTVRTCKGGAIKVTAGYHNPKLTQIIKRQALLASGWVEISKKVFKHGNGLPMDIHAAYAMNCGDLHSYYVGKVVRYYYAKGEPGALHYKDSLNLVPDSEGGKPCMELPEDFPDDIDYDFYVGEANRILRDIGAFHG